MAELKSKPKPPNFLGSVNQTNFLRKIKPVSQFFGSVFQFSGSVFQFWFFFSPLHVRVSIRIENQHRYRNTKGKLSQNALATISFDDLKFTYVLTGQEGSMHDSRVLNDALSRGFCAPEGMTQKFVLFHGVFPYLNIVDGILMKLLNFCRKVFFARFQLCSSKRVPPPI